MAAPKSKISKQNEKQFASLVDHLLNGDWAAKALTDFDIADYEEFGLYCQTQKQNLQTVNRFLLFAKYKDLDGGECEQFCQGVDLAKLAQDLSTNFLNINIIQSFIKLLQETAIPTELQQRFCNHLDHRTLGVMAREKRARLHSIYIFVIRMQKAKISPAALSVFWDELDFNDLGRQALKKGTKLPTLKKFIDLMQKLHTPSINRRKFFKQIDFAKLGEKAGRKQWGLTMVMDFLHRARSAGVSKEAQRTFCNHLDFTTLGKYAGSDEAGLATITYFLTRLGILRIAKQKQRDFFNHLHLPAIARKINAGEIGFATLLKFMSFLQKIGDDEAQANFYHEIDWHKFGKWVLSQKDKWNSLSSLFYQLAISSKLNSAQALQFVKSFGLKNFSQAGFSSPPDTLAALKTLLVERCNLSIEELEAQGITWTFQDWLRSFSNNPFQMAEYMTASRRRFFAIAVQSLQENDASWSFLQTHMASLRAWNILIHNLRPISGQHINDIVLPALKNLSSSQIEKLICEANLDEIGIFLNRFNPHSKVYSWPYNDAVDFGKLNFAKALESATLPAIGFFIFNFYRIGKNELAHRFAGELYEHSDLLLDKCSFSTPGEIDLFFWNWFMALPVGQRPLLLDAPSFHRTMIEKASEGAEAYLQGIIGTMKLSGCQVPEYLKATLNIEAAIRTCQQASDKVSYRLMRLVGGLWAITGGDIGKDQKLAYHRALQKLDQDSRFDIPNQNQATKQITGWLKSAFIKRRKR